MTEPFGMEIRLRRAALGRTQKDVAALANVRLRTLASHEGGEGGKPTQRVRDAIEGALEKLEAEERGE